MIVKQNIFCSLKNNFFFFRCDLIHFYYANNSKKHEN